MDRISVECIAQMNHKEITPVKVRYEHNDERVIIKIDKILQRDKKSTMPYMDHPRTTEYSFKCEAVIEDTRRPFTLTFSADSCRWYMFIN